MTYSLLVVLSGVPCTCTRLQTRLKGVPLTKRLVVGGFSIWVVWLQHSFKSWLFFFIVVLRLKTRSSGGVHMTYGLHSAAAGAHIGHGSQLD